MAAKLILAHDRPVPQNFLRYLASGSCCWQFTIIPERLSISATTDPALKFVSSDRIPLANALTTRYSLALATQPSILRGRLHPRSSAGPLSNLTTMYNLSTFQSIISFQITVNLFVFPLVSYFGTCKLKGLYNSLNRFS